MLKASECDAVFLEFVASKLALSSILKPVYAWVKISYLLVIQVLPFLILLVSVDVTAVVQESL